MTDTAERARTLGPDDPRLDSWRAFLQAHARLFRRLDEELRDEHDISLPEYDALLQIAQAPDRRLRMSHLADRVLLSKSGVTRLIDRLVADGFVERTQCTHDARGAEASLTAAGLVRLREAASTHLRGIERYFLAAVGSDDLGTVARSMESVSRAISGGAPAGEACEVVVDPAVFPAERHSAAGAAPAATARVERAPAG
ncbi:MAG TPA: MarR family transcriptional regulator [Candidatus Limnocylindrales bacterium]|jgi:DNA-binding MarR family transcriptional regulator